MNELPDRIAYQAEEIVFGVLGYGFAAAIGALVLPFPFVLLGSLGSAETIVVGAAGAAAGLLAMRRVLS